jgi:DNA-binding transcriptional ArsR family regulator
VDVYSALADRIRRELLIQLAEGATRVVDLSAVHPVSRPAISRHLRVLSDAGLVRATDQGRERHYELDPRPLAEVSELVHRLVPSRPQVSERHLDALETEVRRTARDRRGASEPSAQQDEADKEHIA